MENSKLVGFGEKITQGTRRKRDGEMGSQNVGACEECVTNCLLIHGKKDPSSPIVSSFFKIILGDSISEALVIPPAFAKRISSLTNKRTYLEDSTGQQWNVNLCPLGSNLAFQKGWKKFASDHSLENGDFVVFSYITGSHFVVKVYGRTGCEKLPFFNRSNNIGRKTTKIPLDRSPPNGRNLGSTGNASPMTEKCSASTSIPLPTTDITLANKQGSCCATHLDSDVEMIENDCNVQGVQKVSIFTEKTSHSDNCTTKSNRVLPKDVPCNRTDTESIFKESNVIPNFDLSQYETIERKYGNGKAEKASVIAEKKMSHSDDQTFQLQTNCEASRMREWFSAVDREPDRQNRASRGLPLNTSDANSSKVAWTEGEPSKCDTTLQRQERTSVMEFAEKNHNAEGTSEGPSPKRKISTCSTTLRRQERTSELEFSEKNQNAEDTSEVSLTQEKNFTGGTALRGSNSLQRQERMSKMEASKNNCNVEDTIQVPPTKENISTASTTSGSTTLQIHERTSMQGFVGSSTGASDKPKASLTNYSLHEEWIHVHSDFPEKDPVVRMEGVTVTRCHESITKFTEDTSGPSKYFTRNGNNLLEKKLKAVKEEYGAMVKETHVENSNICKVLPEEKLNPSGVNDQAHKVVKTENVEFTDHPSMSLANFRCSVSRDTGSFLELPTDFPSLCCSAKRKFDRAIVWLRDPAMKLWPVLYHERAGLSFLGSGWEALTKANNIRKGDVCIFEVENESECIFHLQIARK